MIYQGDDNLIKQIHLGIVESAVSKIIKNLKTVSIYECEYDPKYVDFLL